MYSRISMLRCLPGDDRNERYHIHAYVRPGGVCTRKSMQAQVTFNWLYQNRPDGCRYAVASDWDAGAHARRYLVFDLFHVMRDDQTNRLVTPTPVRMCADLDAAVMATVLLYQ